MYHQMVPSNKHFQIKITIVDDRTWLEKRGNEAVCIQSTRACFEAVIQSQAKPTLHQEEKEPEEERRARLTERERENEQ
jgi:hypothetical protein